MGHAFGALRLVTPCSRRCVVGHGYLVCPSAHQSYSFDTNDADCRSRLFNFIVGLIVPPMLDSIGWGTFIFFAAFSAIAGIWAIFCVHETKGKSLEQIDSFFKNRSRGGRAAADDEDASYDAPVATKAEQLRALLTGSSKQEERVRQYYLADFAMDASKGAFRVDSDASSKVGAQHAENA